MSLFTLEVWGWASLLLLHYIAVPDKELRSVLSITFQVIHVLLINKSCWLIGLVFLSRLFIIAISSCAILVATCSTGLKMMTKNVSSHNNSCFSRSWFMLVLCLSRLSWVQCSSELLEYKVCFFSPWLWVPNNLISVCFQTLLWLSFYMSENLIALSNIFPLPHN